MLQTMILNLLHRIQINRVVVSPELLPLEEIYSSLVQLQDNNLVEQVEALYISISSLNSLRQLCDLVDLALLRAEERAERILSILHRSHFFHVRVALLDFGDLALLHLC